MVNRKNRQFKAAKMQRVSVQVTRFVAKIYGRPFYLGLPFLTLQALLITLNNQWQILPFYRED